MSLSSLIYVLFLLLVFVVYYALPHRGRWLWLLVSSYVFYFTWQPLFSFLLAASTGVTYGFGWLIHRNKSPRMLWTGIGILLLPLLFCKYYTFFNDNLRQFLGLWGKPSPLPAFNLIVPVGISFYTFQAISYLIDIRRNYLQPERHPGYLATYLAFFPTLTAGPIERAKSVLNQLKKPRTFQEQDAVAGLQLIAWGLFKKVVIANPIAELVEPVFAQPGAYGGLVLYSALVLAPFQLFCDFSGYSDIAQGSGRMLGIRLMKNFADRVYASTSRVEFWKGWHISLTTWFRDYVYFPLSRYLRTRNGLYLNLMIVYFLTGFWHGATWGFILWGVFNGLWLVAEHATKPRRQALFQRIWPDLNAPMHRFLSTLLVFHAGAVMGIFLRAPSLPAANRFIGRLLTLDNWHLEIIGGMRSFLQIVLALILMDVVNRRLTVQPLPDVLDRQPTPIRWSLYLVLCLLVLTFGRTGFAQFFYYRF